MLQKTFLHYQTILFILFILFVKFCSPLPLSTNSRWIVDDKTGNRVKLTCVNWAGHLEPLIVEGLQKKPLSYIAENVASMGFNCVRLTWATFMFTRENYRTLTVAESLDHFSLKEAMTGIAKNNPDLLNATVIEAQKAVVNELGKNNVMVVLDNHVSLPQWCCAPDDGNGFFGDANFDPNEWLQGLATIAKLYKDNPNVIAMSVRNELRGSHQNVNDWYQYIPEGAAAIHGENPSLLVIVSGLSYASDFSFLKEKPLVLNLPNKLVYEAHWYSFGPGDLWVSQTNQICAGATQNFIDKSAFVISSNNPVPLFLSEFGVDQRGVNEPDNRFLSCLMATIAEYDLDWALWALQGSYILRQGVVEMEEVYGMFDANSDHIRNSTIQQRLQAVTPIIQDPKSTYTTYYQIFHPQSGQCAQIRTASNIVASDCQDLVGLKQQKDENNFQLTWPIGCLRAVGDGQPVSISSDCGTGMQTTLWKFVSSSKLQIASQDEQGGYLCLEPNFSDSLIVTRKCLCLDDQSNDVSNCAENPEKQWFKIISTNIN